MSVGYVPVQWNRHKRVYDACAVAGILGFVTVFFLTGKLLYPPPHEISDAILLMRALGTCAYLLLHLLLCIGPMARLDGRFLPLLYNRRHLGVATFLVALAHGALATGFYHGFGHVHPLVSLLSSNTNYNSVRAFPFQVLGLGGLAILFLMAATSHDFWLKNLGAATWKRLHMLVYVAYGLLVMHVALGALQVHRSNLPAVLVVTGAAIVAGLHVIAGLREHRHDSRRCDRVVSTDNWEDVGCVDDLTESCGSTVAVGAGERIALFRHGGCITATTNVCAHQGGPLGEGKIIDGCITCPWHGWQYRPSDGRSPPPFQEKLATYRVRVVGRRVEVDPRPLPPGTAIEPARVEDDRRSISENPAPRSD